MEELYEVVCWPGIQNLMDRPGFEDNAFLINDDRGMEKFGSSAYFVNTKWLNG